MSRGSRSAEILGFIANLTSVNSPQTFVDSRIVVVGVPLALTLFMFRDFADHPHHTVAMNNLALIADTLDACSYFHDGCLYSKLRVRSERWKGPFERLNFPLPTLFFTYTGRRYAHDSDRMG